MVSANFSKHAMVPTPLSMLFVCYLVVPEKVILGKTRDQINR